MREIDMKKFIKHFTSFFLVVVMVVSFNITAFAANEKPVDSRFWPEVTYTEDSTPTTRVPNGIKIDVKAYYNKIVVHVGNLGVDSIDSVTVSGTATDYGELSAQTSSVPPIVGKDFTWNVPQTKCHMEYDVSISITDGSGNDFKTGHAELDYTNEKLATLGWGAGSFSSRTDSLDYHFGKHHSEVGVNNMYDYLIAADDCRQDALGNPSNYTITENSGATAAHKYKNKTDKRFIILADSNHEILSFGK